MKRLVRPTFPETFPEDIDRIIRACAAAGYEIDRETARWAWEEYSEALCSSWLYLPLDGHVIVSCVLDVCDAIDHPPTTTVDGDATGAAPEHP